MTKFKYKGTIIDTPNLEKKLKRMKLLIDQVEIIPEDALIEEEIKEEKPYWQELGWTKNILTNKDIYSEYYGYRMIWFQKPEEEFKIPECKWYSDKCILKQLK